MEINDYVRTKNGIIGKYIQPELGKPYITNGISFNEGANYGKHSKDIIELLEVGDILVIDEDPELAIDIEKPIVIESTLELEEIKKQIKGKIIVLKKILTKEQFESNAYKIEKER